MRCKRKLFNRFIHHLPLTSSTFDADLHDDMEAAKASKCETCFKNRASVYRLPRVMMIGEQKVKGS